MIMNKLNSLIYLVGAYKLGRPLYDYMEHYCNNNHRGKKQGISNEQRIKETYNPNGDKWAIVTGASSGIGRCLAIDLAKSDFNLLIVSNAQNMLEKVQRELEDYNPKIKVKHVVADLSKDYSQII